MEHRRILEDSPPQQPPGFCARTSTYHSPRPEVLLPADPCASLPSLLSAPQPPPHWPAFVDSASSFTLSHGQFRHRILSAASGLASFGLRAGDVALLLSPNSIHSPVLMLSTMLAGGVIALANPLSTPYEIAAQVADARPRFVYTTPSLLPKLHGCPRLPVVLLPDPASSHPLAARIQTLASRLHIMSSEPSALTSELDSLASHLRSSAVHAHTSTPSPWPLRTIALSQLLSADPRPPSVRVRQDDPAALLYSSGTTGASKGVIITHRNLIAMASILSASEGGTLHPERTYLCMIPIFHVYGLGMFACAVPLMGSSCIMVPRFSLQEMLQLIQEYRVTHLPAVPPIILALAKMDPEGKYDLSSLMHVLCGAAPVSKELVTAFRARFPSVFIKQGYGLTESTGLGAMSLTEDEFARHDSAGRLTPNMEAKIVDVSSGKFLPPNQQGELWMRGPSIMKGYHGNPTATADTVDSEGWLHTGDLCYFDEGGYLYIVDRIKELIKYKGLQVAPAELEAVLLSHPDIADAAVIPFPDEEAGQIPMSYIVRRPGSTLKEADVMAFVSEKVASYKRIRRVVFIEAIPKSASGKILRRELMGKNSKL